MAIKQVDVLIAGTLVALGFVQLVSDPPAHPEVAALLTLAMTMPVLVRQSWPLPVTVVLAVAAATYGVAIDPVPPFAGFISLLVVMSYTVSRHCRPAAAAAGFAAIAAALAITSILQPVVAWFEWVYPLVYGGGAAAAGLVVRRRTGRHVVDTETRVRAAVSDERGRIARELHDVVAHGLGVMVMQAEAADEVLDSDPGAARRSLGKVQETGREAIGELTLLLGLLRADDTANGHEPQPMLAELPSLVRQFEDSGREVELAMRGDLSALPTGVQLTIYRVVQEALTNVAKHSLTDRVQVHVTADGGQTEVVVADDGPPRVGSIGAGQGLIGMRERAGLYGGTLEAGPQGDGFRIRLEVPVS